MSGGKGAELYAEGEKLFNKPLIFGFGKAK